MHWVQTTADEAVNIRDAVDTGRILVVDDDRVFGGFMIAALETRGHDVEWAGSVQDALTSLYSRRYDLAIIDLRLPDGNGIELLRDATDEGLLEDTAAIILTGHDFDEPDDIRVYHKPLDLDPFLDRMGGIVSHAKKRRAMAHRAPTHQRGVSNDDSRQRKSPKIELVLYTSASSEKCQKAIRTVRAVLEQYDSSHVDFSICDLATHGAHADRDSVVFTPTLVKRGPGPRTWIVGNFDQPELLIDLLEVNGVRRRRD